jgi:hypothetical protein
MAKILKTSVAFILVLAISLTLFACSQGTQTSEALPAFQEIAWIKRSLRPIRQRLQKRSLKSKCFRLGPAAHRGHTILLQADWLK